MTNVGIYRGKRCVQSKKTGQRILYNSLKSLLLGLRIYIAVNL